MPSSLLRAKRPDLKLQSFDANQATAKEVRSGFHCFLPGDIVYFRVSELRNINSQAFAIRETQIMGQASYFSFGIETTLSNVSSPVKGPNQLSWHMQPVQDWCFISN